MLKETRILLRNAGIINPNSIDDYLNAGGYLAFQKALSLSGENVLEQIANSGLRGRGGAGFPTGIKAKAVYNVRSSELKYVVCNADEGEPGTFKDRFILEHDPHSLIEGVLIAAWAVGAKKGFIYIRGEYFEAIEKVRAAIFSATEKGFVGENIKGSGFSFHLEVMPGAGSYLCGEELTLLESLEGKRGYPRIKPPYPAEKGLWGNPTLVNNVETLANLPIIINEGAEAYRKKGTAKSPGTKLVCVSGDVKKRGVFEVEMGCSIHDIIFDLAGGCEDKSEIKAVLLGGAAGTFISEKQLDLPLCFDALAEQGLTLGSGAIIVLGENSSVLEFVGSILKFFKHESCGKCVPCRIGTSHLYDDWMFAIGNSSPDKRKVLESLVVDASKIASACLCPLGQSPVMPLSTALRNIPHLFDESQRS
jgi:NADH:ubiquinone oxidoreductase subunit F (NADH-binding)